MRRIEIIFIFVLLLVPFTARAEEPKDYKCVCEYFQKGTTGSCSNDKQTDEAKLGDDFTVYGFANWESVDVPFTKTGQCAELLEPVFKGGKLICSYYTCHLEAYVLVKEGQATPTFFWIPWYDLKWEQINTAGNPVPVKEGDIGTAEVVASGATSLPITVDCLNCSEYGATYESTGNGKIKIIWDTSKSDVITKVYVMQVVASVGDADTVEKGAISGEVYFSITGVSPVQTKENVDAWIESQYGKPEDYVGALPTCAFSGTCRSVNDLLQLIINFASGMFVIMGSFAFAFFVYGGFKMIVSMGNPEKVKSGRDTMIAAVVGLVVALVAYAAIDLMLDILNVSEDFRGIK